MYDLATTESADMRSDTALESRSSDEAKIFTGVSTRPPEQ